MRRLGTRRAGMKRGATLALAAMLALPGAASAGERVAVPGFEFTDGSGEVRDQTAAHAAQLELFNETLRGRLAADGLDVVVPDCAEGCAPGSGHFRTMAAATRALDANLLLVGGLHKVSTLIGTIQVSLLDLAADKVLCTRVLSYRGDNAEAWTRAAQFTARDVLKACFPPTS